MKPLEFARDLARKPDILAGLADALAAADPWAEALPGSVDRVVFLGMGSSAYAAGVAAARLRARGVCAVSDLASTRLLPAWVRGPSWWRRPPPAGRWKPLTRCAASTPARRWWR